MTNLPNLFRNVFLDSPASAFNEFIRDFDSFWLDQRDYRRFVDADGNVSFEIDVPGFNKDTLNVEVADGFLTVRGNIKTDNMERNIFKRLAIGDNEDVHAEVKNGLLTVDLKRRPQSVKKIELK